MNILGQMGSERRNHAFENGQDVVNFLTKFRYVPENASLDMGPPAPAQYAQVSAKDLSIFRNGQLYSHPKNTLEVVVRGEKILLTVENNRDGGLKNVSVRGNLLFPLWAADIANIASSIAEKKDISITPIYVGNGKNEFHINRVCKGAFYESPVRNYGELINGIELILGAQSIAAPEISKLEQTLDRNRNVADERLIEHEKDTIARSKGYSTRLPLHANSRDDWPSAVYDGKKRNELELIVYLREVKHPEWTWKQIAEECDRTLGRFGPERYGGLVTGRYKTALARGLGKNKPEVKEDSGRDPTPEQIAERAMRVRKQSAEMEAAAEELYQE